MATDATGYFKEQFRSPSAVALPDPYAICKFIQREQRWEPIFSQAFLIKNKILEYCKQQYPSAQTLFPATQPYGPAKVPTAPVVTPEGAPLAGAVVPREGGNVDGSRLNNVAFNMEIFNVYRMRPIRNSSIRRSIRSNALPALPASKVDNQPMCLAYHTKGQCNGDCPLAADHEAYTTVEYGPLRDWCVANYPEGEGN